MRRLRICIDARAPHCVAGGTQQFVIGLVAGLSRLQGPEEYVILGDENTEFWLRPHIHGNCRLEILSAALPRGDLAPLKSAVLRVAPRLEQLLGNVPLLWRFALPSLATSNGALELLSPDVVHFTTQDAFLTAIPSIYHPHDLQHLHLPHLFSKRARYLRERAYRAFCAQASMVAVVSTWTQKDVSRQYGLPLENVRVVPYAPVTQAYATAKDEDAAAFSAAKGLPPRFVLFPAQTWPHKNHAGLLDALALLKSAHGLTVPLVSTGHLNAHYATLRRRAARLGVEDQVHFLGFVSPAELQCLYRNCAAVVIPSLFEAASFPLWEAFLAGVPAACSNVTALPAQAGDAALVFDPRDPSAIADSIRQIWTNPALAAQLVERGRANVARFTWERTAAVFRAHYRRIAGQELGADDVALLDAPPLL